MTKITIQKPKTSYFDTLTAGVFFEAKNGIYIKGKENFATVLASFNSSEEVGCTVILDNQLVTVFTSVTFSADLDE